METKDIIQRRQESNSSIGLLIILILVSFVLMGGCKDKKPLVAAEEEIPADEVTVPASYQAEAPAWVPANASPSVRFYFIPEMEIYYDTYMGNYVYWNGSYWMYSAFLPSRYFYFDLFHTNVVFLTAGVVHPWKHHHFYLSHYPAHFFGGVTFYSHGHGWRFYDEGGGKFFGSHRIIKHRENYTSHYKNLWGSPGHNGKGVINHGRKSSPFYSKPGKFDNGHTNTKKYHQSQTPDFKSGPKLKPNGQRTHQSVKSSKSSNEYQYKNRQQHNIQKPHFTQIPKSRGKKK